MTTALDTAIGQWLDADHRPGISPDLIEEARRSLADLPDGEWGDTEWAAFAPVMEAAAAAMDARGEQVREACQMRGSATVGRVTVRPNGEFVAQSGPVEVRRRQLRDWPTSPHWYVELEDPDGGVETRTDLTSWVDVALAAEELEADWAREQEAARSAARLRVERAAAAVRQAERALAEARAARDEAVRDAMAGGLLAREAAQAAGISQQRASQLRA